MATTKSIEPNKPPPAPPKIDTSEKRSFQTGADPFVKEDLTKAEAEEKGFYWKED